MKREKEGLTSVLLVRQAWIRSDGGARRKERRT